MSCLMLLPGGAAGVWPGRFSGRVMERNMEIGVRDANTSHVASPASLVRRCLLLVGTLLLAWSRFASKSLRWRFVPFIKGTTMPDGFSIWHHLDAQAFLSKSITPKTTLC